MFLSRKPLNFGIFLGLALILGISTVLIKNQQRRKNSAQQSLSRALQVQPDSKVFATYATSKNCKSCHAEIFKLWEGSHHALAERPVRTDLDSKAFDPPNEMSHGSQHSSASLSNGMFQLTMAGTEGTPKSFSAGRVIGVDPLRQFLIPTTGGRWQSTELAVTSDTHAWFDVFGNEDRKPGEWGHWSGRGMTWNVMCAACHNVGSPGTELEFAL